mgnify:CR=1 FL=1
MGLFSSIGNVIHSVTKPISSFLSGSGIGDILALVLMPLVFITI